jgi:hypothetical protein
VVTSRLNASLTQIDFVKQRPCDAWARHAARLHPRPLKITVNY